MMRRRGKDVCVRIYLLLVREFFMHSQTILCPASIQWRATIFQQYILAFSVGERQIEILLFVCFRSFLLYFNGIFINLS